MTRAITYYLPELAWRERGCASKGHTQTAVAEPEVRPIGRQELDELLPLVAGYQRFYGAEPDVERNRRFFSRFLHPSDEGLLLGAWLDGGLAGFATLYWFFSSTKAAESVLMNDLFVREDVRGAGIGRALINRALDEARRHGAAHLEWFTAPDNVVAQRLYDSIPGAKRSIWHAYEIDVGD
jgi:GNAT superfamily N-acetyltransferase